MELKVEFCRQVQSMSWPFLNICIVIFIFWLNEVADKGTHIDDALSFSWSLDDTRKNGDEACVYEEASGSKKVSLRRTKQKLSRQITGYLSQAPSEVTCRNEEHNNNVKILILLQVVILFIFNLNQNMWREIM
jgi:hypothetical protein